MGTLVNTVTADGEETLATTDTNTIPIAQSPAMTVDKTSTTTSITTAGQTVTYSFLVTNTGNVTWRGSRSAIEGDGEQLQRPTTVAVGASMTCTGTHTVTQAEMSAGGNLVNTGRRIAIRRRPTTDTNTIPSGGARR